MPFFSPRTVAGLTCLATLWALGWNAWGFLHLPAPWKWLHLFVTGFATLYAVAWGWLYVYPDVNRQEWSETVAPISFMSYFTVWSAWAIVPFIIRRNDRQRNGGKSDGSAR